VPVAQALDVCPARIGGDVQVMSVVTVDAALIPGLAAISARVAPICAVIVRRTLLPRVIVQMPSFVVRLHRATSFPTAFVVVVTFVATNRCAAASAVAADEIVKVKLSRRAPAASESRRAGRRRAVESGMGFVPVG
jgi:hypothetical protein